MKNRRRITGFLLGAAALLAAAGAFGGTQYWPLPASVVGEGEVLVGADEHGNVQGTTALAGLTSLTLGADGDAMTQVATYAVSVTPTSVTAQTCAEQAVSVSGLTTDDVLAVSFADATSGPAAFVSARVSAEDVAAFVYCNPSGSDASPAAGDANIVAIRF